MSNVDWTPIVDYVSSIYGPEVMHLDPIYRDNSVRWAYGWSNNFKLTIDQCLSAVRKKTTSWDVHIYATRPERVLVAHWYTDEPPEMDDLVKVISVVTG